MNTTYTYEREENLWFENMVEEANQKYYESYGVYP